MSHGEPADATVPPLTLKPAPYYTATTDPDKDSLLTILFCTLDGGVLFALGTFDNIARSQAKGWHVEHFMGCGYHLCIVEVQHRTPGITVTLLLEEEASGLQTDHTSRARNCRHH